MASIEMEVVNENSSASKGFDDDPSDDDPFDSADDDEEMDFDEFAEMELPSSVKSRKDNANSQSKIGRIHGVKNKIQNAQVVHRTRKDNENSQTNMNRGGRMTGGCATTPYYPVAPSHAQLLLRLLVQQYTGTGVRAWYHAATSTSTTVATTTNSSYQPPAAARRARHALVSAALLLLPVMSKK